MTTVPRRIEQLYYLVGLDPAGDNWLALRSDPSTTRGRMLKKMGPDTLLTVLERRGKWLYVRLMTGEIGWAYSKYIACCKEVPNSVPQAAELMISYEQALAFVENLNSRAAVSDLPRFVAENYTNEVGYYDRGTLSSSAVLQDKERWFARWEDWEINMVPNSLSLEQLADGTYRLSYRFRYRWVGKRQSDGSQKVLDGTAIAVRLVKREHGMIKIYSETSELVQ